MEIVPDKEEVAIDAIPLAVKPPSIVDWKIHKEGKKTYYQIIKADGSSKMYLVFSHMLKSFDREDLETLWKLVKAKHGSTRPEKGYERVLWGDLKSIKLLLAEEKFLKIKQVVEEEQTQPEYLQVLLQSLLKDLQILNEIQPLKQETPNQIQKDQEEKSIAELLAEERLQKANQALNESQSPQEMRIQDLEIQKQQCLEEIKEWMNDLGMREYRKEEIDIDYRRKCEDKIYELKDKFNSLSIEIRKIIQKAKSIRESTLELESEDYQMERYLSPPIPISPIFCPSSTIPVVDLDLPLEEADVLSFSDDSILRGIESDSDSGEDTTSIDALPLDDSMILPKYESFTFDDEPVMAEVNVFDEINTSELSYPGIGENVVLDEEEDTFTFTTRSFLPFVTYSEVLPTSYSTGSEDKNFNPGFPDFGRFMVSYLVDGSKQFHNFHDESPISLLHKVGKLFEEVQALYEKIKRSDEDFISIGSAEDERLIKRMNEKGVDSSKSEVLKEESKEEVHEESKEEESTRKRKLGTRKKMKSRKRRYIQNTSEDDSEKENDELRLHLTIAPDEEKEVDYEILDRKYPIKEWKTECLGTKPQTDQAEHFEEINQNVVIRSNGQKRYFSTLMRVLSIFDREDLNAVYQLVMDRYQDEIPEGFDRVLWGDLMVMFNPDDENEFWNSQQDWNIVSWKLHGSSGVHTLVTETGLVIHMLVEKKYPLRKEVLMQMLKLKLESEEDSTMALELIRFIKKLLAELEPEE
ncbi:hypothetical protein Tco_0832708 [Tanacetum coccineum]